MTVKIIFLLKVREKGYTFAMGKNEFFMRYQAPIMEVVIFIAIFIFTFGLIVPRKHNIEKSVTDFSQFIPCNARDIIFYTCFCIQNEMSGNINQQKVQFWLCCKKELLTIKIGFLFKDGEKGHTLAVGKNKFVILYQASTTQGVIFVLIFIFTFRLIVPLKIKIEKSVTFFLSSSLAMQGILFLILVFALGKRFQERETKKKYDFSYAAKKTR